MIVVAESNRGCGFCRREKKGSGRGGSTREEMDTKRKRERGIKM